MNEVELGRLFEGLVSRAVLAAVAVTGHGIVS